MNRLRCRRYDVAGENIRGAFDEDTHMRVTVNNNAGRGDTRLCREKISQIAAVRVVVAMRQKVIRLVREWLYGRRRNMKWWRRRAAVAAKCQRARRCCQRQLLTEEHGSSFVENTYKSIICNGDA